MNLLLLLIKWNGVWKTLYAAVREEQNSLAFIEDFITTAIESCFSNLKGIKVPESLPNDATATAKAFE